MKGIKNPYGEILIEIEIGLWEHNIRIDQGIALPYKYTDKEFRACLKIFTEALLWKLWSHFEKSSQRDKIDAANNLGEKLRSLIKEYTGVNAHKLYEEG